jgi:integrase
VAAESHIAPYLGNATLAGITPDAIRDWRARLLSEGVSESAAAKAYRLLRAVLATATDDRAIARNPCRIRGAGDENPAERPVLTIRQVCQLADSVAPRYRAPVLVLTFASLRWGEAIALRRRDLDVLTGTVTVRQQYIELSSGHKLGPPKSRAGARTLAVPSPVVGAIAEHLVRCVPADEHALLFTGPLGGILRRGNFRRDSGWKAATSAIGMQGLHVHDLWHTGNTLAAQGGTSIADLKARMGHDSARTALIYQHATTAADKKIAEALGQAIESAEPAQPRVADES